MKTGTRETARQASPLTIAQPPSLTLSLPAAQTGTHPMLTLESAVKIIDRYALYFTSLDCTVLHCTALCCTLPHLTVLYCTVLCCTILHCAGLHCTVMYCNALHRVPPLIPHSRLLLFPFPHLHYTSYSYVANRALW